ncbi:MAG: response regulator transcription factor [Deltaproteobacteria bacterium]|nr:response regulator transcription factor [Deltaproteobacteria bacterium]
MKILIVEDEPKVVAFLKQGLEELGYETAIAEDGKQGQELIEKQPYDLYLLDILLPFVDGNSLCNLIKGKYPTAPVIMITALGTLQNKLDGFDAGADDYLVKPFEFKELVARIKVLTKRAVTPGEKSRNILKASDLELDLDKKLAYRMGREIFLSAKEFALLEYLMRNRGRVVSRPEIAEKIWDITFDTGTNVVDVYINLLRKKINKDAEIKLIQTRIGHGYILEQD